LTILADPEANRSSWRNRPNLIAHIGPKRA
jgi:hypothetical protein